MCGLRIMLRITSRPGRPNRTNQRQIITSSKSICAIIFCVQAGYAGSRGFCVMMMNVKIAPSWRISAKEKQRYRERETELPRDENVLPSCGAARTCNDIIASACTDMGASCENFAPPQKRDATLCGSRAFFTVYISNGIKVKPVLNVGMENV